MGTSGNPCHNGHFEAIYLAAKQHDASVGIIFSNSASPDGKVLLPALDRYEMLAAGASHYPAVQASPIEVNRGGISLTKDTLAEFRLLHPASTHELLIVVGEDVIVKMPTWVGIDEVLSRIDGILVSPRSKNGHLKLPQWQAVLPQMPVKAIEVSGKYADLSSSVIRDLLAAGRLEEVRELVPPAVFDILLRKRYYQPILR